MDRASKRGRRDSSAGRGPGTRPVILVLVRYYLPGFKSGGPVRSIANMVSLLGNEFDFRIVAKNRDFMDSGPYPDVVMDQWSQVGLAKVWYLGGEAPSLQKLVASIRTLGAFTLYLNSLFDPLFSILPLIVAKTGLIRPSRTIIATRGELSSGALELKSWRKTAYLRLSQFLGLYEKVHWHASTSLEKRDIANVLPRSFQFKLHPIPGVRPQDKIKIAGNVFVASDLVDFDLGGANYTLTDSIAFLSRITRKKNLDFALQALSKCKSRIRFNIYGTIEEEEYWAECRQIIDQLPAHIEVAFHGALRPDQVGESLRQNSLFLFPTRGENYGHVIAEALAAGLPLLLSDQTPWNDIEEKGAGWIRPLTSPSAFAEVIDSFMELDREARRTLADSVNEYARKSLQKPADVEDNRKLFSPSRADERHAAIHGVRP